MSRVCVKCRFLLAGEFGNQDDEGEENCADDGEDHSGGDHVVGVELRGKYCCAKSGYESYEVDEDQHDDFLWIGYGA